MFDKWLVFTKTNARWVKSPKDRPSQWDCALKNPSTAHLHNVPMVFWKCEVGQVVEMSQEEKEKRIVDIASIGYDNLVSVIPNNAKALMKRTSRLSMFWSAIKSKFKRKVEK